MAIVSDDYEFVFIHIPKTAGTSITKALPNGRKVGDTHAHARIIASELPYASVSYFYFSWVRNPWDRLYSMYKFRTGRERRNITFEQWFQEDLHRTDIEQKQTPEDEPLLPNLMKPQVNWLKDSNGHLMTDFIGRYENLHEDFDLLCRKLGLGLRTLPHTQQTKSGDYRDVYTPYLRDFVAEHFKEDIELFGYDF